MNRKERRAAMRTANNHNSNTQISSAAAAPKPTPTPAKAASDAQFAANRANAQFSTGPKTETGKRTSSCNAVKTALTGMTVLLPTDNVADYQQLAQNFIALHQPVGFEEELLVQSLIDTEWRLLRIPSQEAGVYALGRVELADTVPAHLLESAIYLKYERNLKNLRMHENRLRRYRENDLKSLKELQSARREQEAAQQKAAPQQQPAQPPPPQAAHPEPEIGFVFVAPETPVEIAAEPPLTNAA